MAEQDIDQVRADIARMAESGAGKAKIDRYVELSGFTPMDIRHGGKVDLKSGAPWRVRAVVGLYDSPERRLAALQKFFPDAKAEGEDNFVFTDPGSGGKVLYNPAGFDAGDVASVGREVLTGATATAGAIAGAAGGTVAAPGPGTVGGAALGAGAGGLVGGIMADDIAGWLSGQRLGGVERAKNALSDFALNAAGEGAGAVVAKVLGPSVSKATGMTGEAMAGLAQRLGIPLPTRGTAWQNKGLQSLEQAVANTWGGAQIMENANRRTLDAMRSKLDAAAGSLGTVFGNAEELGAAAIKAAESSREGLRQEAARRFGSVYDGIDRAGVSSLDNAAKYISDTLDGLSTEAERARFLRDPTVARVKALIDATAPQPSPPPAAWKGGYPTNADPGAAWGAAFSPPEVAQARPQLDVQTLRSALTDLSQRLRPGGNALDTASASEAQLNGLLRSLATDRDAAVSALGRGKELADANAWYSAEKSLREGLGSIFGSKYRPVDLELLASGGAGEAVSLDAAQVGQRLLRPDLPRNVQDALRTALGDSYGDIAATRIARMGDATPGAQGATDVPIFSPSTFLTNVNKGARVGGEAVTPSGWDDFLKVASALKDAEKMANTSGTARALGGMGMLQALAGGGAGAAYDRDNGWLAGAAGGAIAPSALAMLLANPRMATNPATMRVISRVPGALSRLLGSVATQ